MSTAVSSEACLLQCSRWTVLYLLSPNFPLIVHIAYSLRERKSSLRRSCSRSQHLTCTRSSPSPSSQLSQGMTTPASIRGQFPRSHSRLLEDSSPQSLPLRLASLISSFLLAQAHQHQRCPVISNLETNEPETPPSVPYWHASPS